MVLEHYGLDPKKDVKFFLAGGADTALVAMQQGLIHARPFNPDAAFVLKQKAFNVLAVLAYIGPWPWGGYASTVAKLSQERNKIKRWTRAMARSLLHMANRKDDTIRIARQEFSYPREVLEEALAVSVKAIDLGNPGGATQDSLRRNVQLTIVEPLNLKETPALAGLVDFSLLHEVQAELSPQRK